MKPAITFVQPFDATFIEKDRAFLEEHFKLHTINQKGVKGIKFLLFQIRLFFFLIYALPKSKGVFIWFADYHAFLPVLFSRIMVKKSLVVIGGYDATSIPELKYGSFYRPIRALLTKWVIRHASYVLPVAASLGDKLIGRVSNLRGKIMTVPTGYSPTEWYCTHEVKEDLIMTVAHFDNVSRFRLKGLDFFIQVAEKMPEYQFLMIGASPQAQGLLTSIPPNLAIMNRLSQNQLRDYYSKAKVYAQFSLSEGLPNAVCEAMLCECVPVGTDVGGMKSAIGECGVVLEKQDLTSAVAAIHFALKNQKNLGKEAKKHIERNFHYDLRYGALLNLLDMPTGTSLGRLPAQY